MENIDTKSTGDSLTAVEFNNIPDELENAITSTGITLSGADLTQLTQAISVYAAGGAFYTDTGSSTLYVLGLVGSKAAPPAYFVGMSASFVASNNNSTATPMINVAGLGAKNILADGGGPLSVNDITTSRITTVVYDGTDFTLNTAISGATVNHINTDAAVADLGLVVGNRVKTDGRVTANDGGAGNYLVVAGATGTPDGGSYIDLDNGNQIELVVDKLVSPLVFGIVNDGVTDDTTPYTACRDFVDSIAQQMDIDGVNVNIPATHEAPVYGFHGRGTILGGVITVTQSRKVFVQSGQLICDEITFSGVQYCKTEWIEVNGVNGPVNLDGNSLAWGTFWNNFGTFIGQLNIDTSQGNSVNQNTFEVVRGPIHIFGGIVSPTEPQECDNNLFKMVDSTNGNITAADATTGWHILNESEENQRNVIQNWYAEATGKRSMRGNFHVLSSFVDSSFSPFALPPTNHVLFNPDHTTRDAGDYFAGNPKGNLAKGGLWDILNATDLGQPLAYTKGGGTTGDVSADATEPTGIGFRYGGVNAAVFSAFNIALTHSQTGRYNLFFWLKLVSGGVSMQINNDGDPKTISPEVFHDAGNDWRLYRVSLAARSDGVDDRFEILTAINPTEVYLGACWASPYKTCFLPSLVPAEEVKAVSTDGTINKADALPVGGRVENRDSALATTDPAEWVKISGGTFSIIATVP